MLDSLIAFYQLLESGKHQILITVFGFHSVCRHRPTCSQYLRQQLKTRGTIGGLFAFIMRLATCW